MIEMKNVTKMMIEKPAEEVYEAFVDPEKIGDFWFSSSSLRWEQGKKVTLRYDEYGAEVNIEILELKPNKKITFVWGKDHEVTIKIDSGDQGTVVEVSEDGFEENAPDLIQQMIDNKEGWVYMLTCLKGYLEHDVSLRASLVK